MVVTKKNKESNQSSKKEVREILTSQLEKALPDFKKELGEGKFHLRLKKAVKALTKNFKATPTNGAVHTATEKKPITEKLPSKGKKAAKKKSAKKKMVAKKKEVKVKHSDAPSKVN